MPVESGYIENGNARIFYQLAGQGQPLVMIHAGVADHRQWELEFEAFASKHCVLRYDLRGYGLSLPVEGEFSHMSDLVALLDQLGMDGPLVLMGCSMGGSLALDFALAHPERVKALVLVGSGVSGLKLDVPAHPLEEEAERAYLAGERDTLAELEARIWFDGLGRTPEQVDAGARRLFLEMNGLALAHDAKKLGKHLPDAVEPAVDRLEQVQAPVLVVVGEHDLPFLHAAADYLLEHLPSAHKVVLADAAHLPNMDHPAEFQQAVRAFLEIVLRMQAGVGPWDSLRRIGLPL